MSETSEEEISLIQSTCKWGLSTAFNYRLNSFFSSSLDLHVYYLGLTLHYQRNSSINSPIYICKNIFFILFFVGTIYIITLPENKVFFTWKVHAQEKHDLWSLTAFDLMHHKTKTPKQNTGEFVASIDTGKKKMESLKKTSLPRWVFQLGYVFEVCNFHRKTPNQKNQGFFMLT